VSSEKNVWVLAEHNEGKPSDTTLEIFNCGRQLADKLGGWLCAVVIGSDNQELADLLGSYGADKVYLIHSPRLLEYNAEYYVDVLSNLFQETTPDIVISGATLIGKDLAPRLAARLKTGLVSECTGLTLNEEGFLTGTKLTHGGRVSSTIIWQDTKPQIATIKPGILSTAKAGKPGKPEIAVISLEPSSKESRTRLKEVVKADPEKIGLDEADVIISGGKGVGSRENFKILDEMAKLLEGTVAGSLGAVDEDWLPRRKLVGQTGTTVTPKLYVACGISGSVYHVLGMKDAEFVIAINKDADAPIFKVADMSIIGDVTRVLPAIIKRLRITADTTTGNNRKESDAGEI